MPYIYGPSSNSSVQQAQKAAEKFGDQIKSAVSCQIGVREAEQKQWEEMTALAQIIIEIEGKI